jgi:hypothetical protein
MPDSALLDSRRKLIYLVEYKAMTTPLWSKRRLQALRQLSEYNDLTSANVGLVETAALQNYRRLTEAGLRVALVVYCAYHPQRLLAEWEERVVTLHSDRVRLGSSRASFIPYTNVHLDHMLPLADFLLREHALDEPVLRAAVERCKEELGKEIGGRR